MFRSICKDSKLKPKTRVADPHHFYAETDPDQAFHFNKDPDLDPHQSDCLQPRDPFERPWHSTSLF